MQSITSTRKCCLQGLVITLLEKTCVALVSATRKLRHYLRAYKVLLITRMDPLKYLMEKPVQDGKIAKWVLLL